MASRISDVICVIGRSGYFHKDLAAARAAAKSHFVLGSTLRSIAAWGTARDTGRAALVKPYADFHLHDAGRTLDIVADANGDGRVDAADLAIWRSNFGSVSSGLDSSSHLIPEPDVSLMLAAILPCFLGSSRVRARI